MAQNFFWYELMTSDVAAAKTFYADVVGWAMQPFPGGDYYTILQAGERGVGGMMALPADYREAGGRPAWTGYVSTPDVDAAAERVKAAGGSVHAGPEDIPGVGRFAAVADPQGARFMLMTPGGGGEMPPPAEGTPGTVGWRELATTSAKDALDFYAGQFGWSESGTFDMGPMGLYRLFAVDGAETGGMMDAAPGMPPPRWTYYFTVPDIDAALERVRAGGGTVAHGPMEVPGGSRVGLCADPQGAAFALLTPPG